MSRLSGQLSSWRSLYSQYRKPTVQYVNFGFPLSLHGLTSASEFRQALLKRKAIRLRQETGNQLLRAPLELDTRSITKTVLTSCIVPFGEWRLLIHSLTLILDCSTRSN
jgi:hypothetical protein